METHEIKNVDSICYFANFITEEEEREILAQVYKAPKPKWTHLSNRRLQNWGGVPHSKGMIAEPIPKWLEKCVEKTTPFFPDDRAPNHILVNEYLAGQGIMPHTDGPLFHPVICTISCGSHTILNFQKSLETETVCSVLLERRSLVIVTGEMYHNFLHSITEKTADTVHHDEIVNLNLLSTPVNDGDVMERGNRISLTIRHVPHTSKFKLKMFKT